MTTYRESAREAAAFSGRVRIPTEEVIDLLDGAVDELSSARRRARSAAAQVDAESATLAGVLLDAAETARHVGVTLVDHTALIGKVETVGTDVLTLSTGPDSWAIVPMSSVSVLEPLDRERRAGGDRRPTGASLASTLFALAPLRPTVAITVRGRTERLNGRLWSCGHDVCTLRCESGRTLHLAIDALVLLRVFDVAAPGTHASEEPELDR